MKEEYGWMAPEWTPVVPSKRSRGQNNEHKQKRKEPSLDHQIIKANRKSDEGASRFNLRANLEKARKKGKDDVI